MALLVTTDDPNGLWEKLKTAISEKQIETWRLHKDGKHLTHTSEQWSMRAWFRPARQKNRLVFNIIHSKGRKVTNEVYAEYHGLLLRMLLFHFEEDFTVASATALPTDDDVITSK